ncbi:MAG: hybrid sensor histidine kinase/response regulator [Bacteroidota bacterium]|nr:hybrid sensor histidine kinase/response regulator [Bacteroidota bacterium]MDP4193738.1 hybrid sensor histidine kinase/response regulator [Bacteroidota bacterium]
MYQDYIKVLLIEDNISDARLINELINEAHDFRYSFDHTFHLPDALEKLKMNNYDVVLLDIDLPDGSHLDSLKEVQDSASSFPIIIMTALEDETLATKAAEMGAQDYLPKSQMNSYLLSRSIRYTIERKKIEKMLLESKELLEKNASEMTQLNKRLQEVIAGKDKFLSILSHDLKSPFQGLLGLSKSLVEEYFFLTDEERLKYANYLNTTTLHLYNLIENLLQWSRIETDKANFQPSELELYSELAYVMSFMNARLVKKNISLINKVEHDKKVFADSEMLTSLLENLISNAVKFTDIGGSICISTFECERNNKTLGICVEDNGKGISPEDMQNLFRIDVRQSRSGTEGEKGTGLGLLICKEIVEKHGGRIWAESQPGQGSTFKFTLPKQAELKV